MTRGEARDELFDIIDNGGIHKRYYTLVDNIYDDIEAKNKCTGCRYEPQKKGDFYPEQCGSCKRWYPDMWEIK